MYDDAYTRNENDELAVRTVVATEGSNSSSYDDVFTITEDGKRAVRVVGSGGSDAHNKGYFADQEALEEAHPTAEPGDYAIVGSTDSVWVWDEDNSEWVDTGNKGAGSTYNTFPAGWTTNSTTKTFCDDIAADTTATVGMAYLGEVTFSDLPASMVNAEVIVEIMAGTTSSNKVIVLTCTSGNTAPYKWQYTYWNNGTDVSGWKTWATSEQGAKADTAVQPSDLATVATTGNYNDLSNKPAPSIPQYETLPTPSSSNVGEIVQYSGATTPDVPASATIEQTTGSGLTDLAVNVAAFEGVEQPSGAETVTFTATVIPGSISYSPNKVSDPNNYLLNTAISVFGYAEAFAYILITQVNENNEAIEVQLWSTSGGFAGIFQQDLENNNVSITDVAQNDTITATWNAGSITWAKDNETVDITAYGISFNGTVADGDVLTVSYEPFVAGITNGYFYKGSIEYGEPTATIEQTTGSGLSDLSVNVETFIEAEQPTQDEEVEFVSAGTVRTMSQTSGTSGDISLSITNVDDFLTEIGSLDSVYIGTGSVITVIYATGNGDDRPYQISVEYTVNGINYVRWDLPADQYSVVVSGTSPAGTLMRPIENATVSSEDFWTKNNESIDIAAYGISYSGLPTTGDVLTVTYTAPAPIGYSWNRTDVQPSSGSGGSGSGIEWAASMDLPDTFGQEVYAQWTVEGGLPDGTYEFYLSSLCTTTNESIFPFNRRVYKVIMTLYTNESQERHFNAIWSPVLNGDFMPDGNYELPLGPNTTWSLLWAKGSDIILCSQERPLFSTDIPTYRSFTAVPDCFKISKIKNMENGMEYIPTGIVTDFTPPQDSTQIYGEVRFNLVQSVSIPQYQNSGSYAVSEFASQGQSFMIYVNNSDDYKSVKELWVRLQHPASDAEFDATVNFGAYGKATAIQEIRKATGLFANCKFKFTNTFSEIFLTGFDDTLAGTLSGSVYINAGASANSLGWNLIIPQDTLYDIEQGGKKGYRLDTPIAETIGNILQYVGNTDANYTNGYFYKAAGTIVDVPGSVTCTETSSTGKTITMDVDGFVAYMVSMGYNKSTITGWLNEPNWEFLYNVDANELTWNPYGLFANTAEVLNFITFSPAASSGEIITWNTSNYVPASRSVQNARWDRVNAQPLDLTGITGYDATKTQVLKNVLGTLTWVDEV